MKKQFLILALLMTITTALTTGCMTLPQDIDPTKPVETSSNIFVPIFKQDGHVVSEMSSAAKFATLPEAKSALRASQIYAVSSLLVGAGTVGYVTASASATPDGARLGIISGLFATQFLLLYLARSEFIEAATIYNKQLPSTKITKWDFKPFVNPVDRGATAGLIISF